MPTFTNLLMLARLCDAAYEPDTRETKRRVESLGLDFIAQVASQDCAAVVAGCGGRQIVALKGTSIAGDINRRELWDDLDVDPVETPAGAAMDGFWTPLRDLWPVIAGHLDPARPLLATGHSLGGARAHLVPVLARCEAVVSFGAPMAATDGFWRCVYGAPGSPPLTRVVNADDFAPGWPWLDGPSVEYIQPPGPFLWLHGSEARVVTWRPPVNLSLAAHSIDGAYIPTLERLAASRA